MHVCRLMRTMMHGYILGYVLSPQLVSMLLFAAVSTCTTFHIIYFILGMTALMDFITLNIVLLNALLEYFISLLITSL